MYCAVLEVRNSKGEVIGENAYERRFITSLLTVDALAFIASLPEAPGEIKLSIVRESDG